MQNHHVSQNRPLAVPPSWIGSCARGPASRKLPMGAEMAKLMIISHGNDLASAGSRERKEQKSGYNRWSRQSPPLVRNWVSQRCPRERHLSRGSPLKVNWCLQKQELKEFLAVGILRKEDYAQGKISALAEVHFARKPSAWNTHLCGTAWWPSRGLTFPRETPFFRGMHFGEGFR